MTDEPADLAAVLNAVAAVQNTIGDLSRRVDAQAEAYAQFRADITDELGRTRNALMTRMDRLQEALTT